jgi:predicted deacylase
MPEIELQKKKLSAGRKHVVTVPVTHDLAMRVDIHAHVVAGDSEGPTLLLLSMLHGNEWFSVLILRELIRRLDPKKLAGNVIAIPVANTPSFMTGTRVIVDDSDEPDCNRTFGGIYEWMTNQITRVIDDEFLSQSTHLIDYHVSDWGSTMADVSYTEDFTDPKVSETSREMALAYGFPVLHALRIHSGLRGPRTSLGFAGETYKIPGIVAGVGGLGFGEEQEGAWLEQNVRGTVGVMQQIGMLEGDAERCERVLQIGDYWRVSPKVGGYLEPSIGLDRQFTEFEEGELMGTVVSPLTFAVIDELRSPGRGTLFYSCRSYMVRPGGWAFGVADMEKSQWVDFEKS